ncbi:DUF4440 domain-containing protein [Xenorhabdus thuongxuanensis]|uniref:Cytoplasmic protein n=1 Tax=Xenorhabdus thuongxuanensis TaxID=1873484 RepID=A0A1Q5TIU7_9GAMM|nr:DUF4440 domain-containing protein [Xenorhabdus thuongxuanensis]OKP00150.1 cytoplasmic protein [Xenorhabdus thuongxuanensis]
MNHYINEVLESHVAIENWLGKGEGDVQTLLNRFSQDYSMITITGTMLDHESLSHFFIAKRASRPGLHIVVDSLSVLQEWENGAVILYREQQTEPDKETTIRWSTAIFNLHADTPVWLHLHETLQPINPD